jgi:SAM-dependent methyltransferase
MVDNEEGFKLNMVSIARQECTNAVQYYASKVPSSGDLLYVGIAGDPPGGEYTPLFPNYNVKTFDMDPKWGADLEGDISKTNFAKESWDLIICVQVLEHVSTIWDVPAEMHRILTHGGHAIVDCPWQFPYHAEPPSFADYWRISKDGMRALFEPHFEILDIQVGQQNTSILIRKPEEC